MTPSRFQWLSMSSFDSLWVTVVPYEFQWLPMSSYDTLWTYITLSLSSYDSLWVLIDSLYFLFTSYDSLWIHFTPYDYLWVHMSPFEFLWLSKGSNVFLSVYMTPKSFYVTLWVAFIHSSYGFLWLLMSLYDTKSTKKYPKCSHKYPK